MFQEFERCLAVLATVVGSTLDISLADAPSCQKMGMLKIPIHAHGITASIYMPMDV